MKVFARLFSVCFLALLLASPAEAQYDILIRNGRLLDGTGNPWRQADVGIVNGRITAVGDLSDASAETEIDAEGLYVSPGFIDPHSHAGPGLTTEGLSQGQPILAQGVTTVMINPDGGGDPDLAAQRENLLRYGLGPNVVQLVPHGGVRGAVMGPDDRDPTAWELDEMREMVREGMEQGAWGLSSGP
ncbi:MAG: amidohydrolase family protein, partial [Gemmatimonadota bacterium]|nr:amidohydrolase family protein [Gemmatimonadota bacterium]